MSVHNVKTSAKIPQNCLFLTETSSKFVCVHLGLDAVEPCWWFPTCQTEALITAIFGVETHVYVSFHFWGGGRKASPKKTDERESVKKAHRNKFNFPDSPSRFLSVQHLYLNRGYGWQFAYWTLRGNASDLS